MIVHVPARITVGTQGGGVTHDFVIPVSVPPAPPRSLADATTDELLEELRRRATSAFLADPADDEASEP